MEFKMKKFLKVVVGLAIFIAMVYPASTLKAQVFGEFTEIEIVDNVGYQSIKDNPNTVIIPDTVWGQPPNYVINPQTDLDLDNGYYGGQNNFGIPMGFEYEFNGEIYSSVFININGFITFGQRDGDVFKQPPFLAAATKTPNALFFEDPTYPVNVLAPFWGDHKYRRVSEFFDGFAITEIMYLQDDVNNRFIVEWKDLNINYMFNGEEIKSSVGNFQVIIYESEFEYSRQGDIEFAYGQVNTNNNSGDSRVITQGASVGIKGEGIVSGGEADFLNGLVHDEDETLEEAGDSKILTQAWTPSGGTDKRIKFTAAGSANFEEFWGDGDVDFSKAEGNKHFNLPQNRYVTVNDARIIMNSVATKVPLDPIRRRAAYHGDVNHDGRYYINEQGTRVNIPWRNKIFSDSLPNEVSSLKQILFEANEEDAAWIMAYLGAHVIELPWLLDTLMRNGKITDYPTADNFVFGEPQKMNELYQVPVYLDKAHDGKLSGKFDLNAEVDMVIANKQLDGNRIITTNGTKTVVFAGFGKFSATEPIATIFVRSASDAINVSDIRFNNEEKEDISIISSVEENVLDNSITTIPNPMSNNTTISVNLNTTANYDVSVYDMLGNKVKTLGTGVFESGINTFDWDRTNINGNRVNSGVYFLRIEGNSNVLSQKIIVE
jgi:hypothetical protein